MFFQADAIISRIRSEGYVERIDEPTLLITSDIVCLKFLDMLLHLLIIIFHFINCIEIV